MKYQPRTLTSIVHVVHSVTVPVRTYTTAHFMQCTCTNSSAVVCIPYLKRRGRGLPTLKIAAAFQLNIRSENCWVPEDKAVKSVAKTASGHSLPFSNLVGALVYVVPHFAFISKNATKVNFANLPSFFLTGWQGCVF